MLNISCLQRATFTSPLRQIKVNNRSIIIKASYKHKATTSVIIIHVQIEMMLFSWRRDHLSLSCLNGVFGTGRRRLIFAVEKGVMSETPPNPDPSALSVRWKRLFLCTASRILTFGMPAVQKRDKTTNCDPGRS